MQANEVSTYRTRTLVVFDDDPTGIQTVHSCKVLTEWDTETLKAAFSDKVPFFYILTNIRAFPQDQAREVLNQAIKSVKNVAAEMGKNIEVLARSDSTLRSHFPLEIALFSDNFYPDNPADAVLFAPAFFESGRLTAGDTHFVVERTQRIPVDETEFANDPDFSYTTAYLPAYIEEKTRAAQQEGWCEAVSADEIETISLDLIRSGGAERITEKLMGLSGGCYTVINAESYKDLDVVTAAVRQAVDRGKRFLYHTSSSFVRSIMQQASHQIDLSSEPRGPGLVVVGSYVNKTERQINCLLKSNAVDGIPVSVDRIVQQPEKQKQSTLKGIQAAFSNRKSAVLYLLRSHRPEESEKGEMWRTGQKITEFFCRCVDELNMKPSFIIGKGGITSHQVLKNGLKVAAAWVAGQVVPGVPAIRMEAGHRFADMYYVIFPGNVGSDETLAEVVSLLEGRSEE